LLLEETRPPDTRAKTSACGKPPNDDEVEMNQ
jgi:hypothetical protein